MKQVLIRELGRPATLFRRALDQDGWLPVFIELDPATGALTAGVCLPSQDRPAEEAWQNRRLRFFLRAPVGREQANRTMEDMAPLAQRVLDGAVPAGRGWRFTDDAKDAVFGLSRLAYDVVPEPTEEATLAARFAPAHGLARAA